MNVYRSHVGLFCCYLENFDEAVEGTILLLIKDDLVKVGLMTIVHSGIIHSSRLHFLSIITFCIADALVIFVSYW